MPPVIGSELVAASENVMFAALVAVELPTSDISIKACPVGATTAKSMLLVRGSDTLFSVTVTAVSVPLKPETAMIEGYGLEVPLGTAPLPRSAKVIEAGLENAAKGDAAELAKSIESDFAG